MANYWIYILPCYLTFMVTIIWLVYAAIAKNKEIKLKIKLLHLEKA